MSRRTPFCACATKAGHLAPAILQEQFGHGLRVTLPSLRHRFGVPFVQQAIQVGGNTMFSRTSRNLSRAGVVLLLFFGTTSVLFATDTAAGLQAFRRKDYLTAYREWKAAAD